MSVLTKVFVVLVAVLSVMLVTLIVPFVANTENYRKQAEEQKNAYDAAKASAALVQQENQALMEKETQRVSELKQTIQGLQERNSTLTTQLASAEAATAAEKAAGTQAEANISRLAAAEEQHASINKALDAELQSLRPERVKQQTQIIQLLDRNNELSTQVEAVIRQVRRYSEENTQLGMHVAQLEATLAKVAPGAISQEAGSQQPYLSDVLIQGTVTDVQKADDTSFAQINVGKNDGVQENMKFLVHRGGKFVGTLVVTKVDIKASAGRVMLAQGEIKTGDLVLSGHE
ncbi:MAG: hypothetical protein K8S99_17590 [Planctomycetes bacterium]|nr:hypothetical protein [Planctomycetota bacterium]